MKKSIIDQIKYKIENKEINTINDDVLEIIKIPDLTVFSKDIRVFEIALLHTPTRLSAKEKDISVIKEKNRFIFTLWFLLMRTEKKFNYNI